MLLVQSTFFPFLSVHSYLLNSLLEKTVAFTRARLKSMRFCLKRGKGKIMCTFHPQF